MSGNNETYLGDGLYGSFDGYQFKLRAPHSDGGDQEIYLDQPTLHAFFQLICDNLGTEIEMTAKVSYGITKETVEDK